MQKFWKTLFQHDVEKAVSLGRVWPDGITSRLFNTAKPTASAFVWSCISHQWQWHPSHPKKNTCFKHSGTQSLQWLGLPYRKHAEKRGQAYLSSWATRMPPLLLISSIRSRNVHCMFRCRSGRAVMQTPLLTSDLKRTSSIASWMNWACELPHGSLRWENWPMIKGIEHFDLASKYSTSKSCRKWWTWTVSRSIRWMSHSQALYRLNPAQHPFYIRPRAPKLPVNHLPKLEACNSWTSSFLSSH